jgi:uncharacterized membrane protein
MMHDRGLMLTGLGVGAGLMYLLDPRSGRRRRALVRDQVVRSANRGADALGTTGRDLTHRAGGVAWGVRRIWPRGRANDRVIADRVRAELGRWVSHPHAIDVDVRHGCVTLHGPILQAEVKPLVAAVGRVAGVRDVTSALEEHRQAANVPALQGGSAPPIPRMDVLQREWSPATRALVCTAGTALATYGVLRRDAAGAMLAAAGVGCVVRASTNLETKRLFGVGAGRRAVDVQKTMTIDAPVEDVFRFWTAYENFPRFMSRVLDVRPGAREQQSHWRVAGPAGVPVEFDAEVSALVPNRAFGWRTIEDSTVAHAGLVHFEPTAEGQTRVHVRMSYNPPGGWFGHGVAAAFGVDPKSSMDADLVRVKTLLETGRPARDAARPDVH